MVSVTYPMIDDITRLADSLAGLMDKLGITRASIVGIVARRFSGAALCRAPRRPGGPADPGQYLVGPRADAASGGPVLPVDALRAHPPRMHRDMVVNSVRSWPETDPFTASLKTLLIDSDSGRSARAP